MGHSWCFDLQPALQILRRLLNAAVVQDPGRSGKAINNGSTHVLPDRHIPEYAKIAPIFGQIANSMVDGFTWVSESDRLSFKLNSAVVWLL